MELKRATAYALCCLLGIYVAMAVYFVLGRPSPKVDYVALYNAPVLAMPEGDRAWPIYREALLKMMDSGAPKEKAYMLPAFLDEPAQNRPKVNAWLNDNTASIELLWKAVDKPAMGYIASAPFAPTKDPLLKHWAWHPTKEDYVAPSLAMSLSYLNDIRQIAYLIFSNDAVFARERQDADRCGNDLIALLNLARQLHDSHSALITYFTSMDIYAAAVEQIQTTLIESPHLLSDQTLTMLAHSLAKQKTAGDLLSFEGERLTFLDTVQYTFTDNGHGDGRITPDGLRLISKSLERERLSGEMKTLDVLPMSIGTSPFALSVTPSRHELIAAYDELMDRYERRLDRPLRNVVGDSSAYQMLAKWKESKIDSQRYAIVMISTYYCAGAIKTAELSLGLQEGTSVAIALELYRRKYGRYPNTLAELSPLYLPQVPVDRITGGPLKYRLLDGKPLIYSVGADRDDDGGAFSIGRGTMNPLHQARPMAIGFCFHSTNLSHRTTSDGSRAPRPADIGGIRDRAVVCWKDVSCPTPQNQLMKVKAGCIASFKRRCGIWFAGGLRGNCGIIARK